MPNRNEETLKDFAEHCRIHPHQRFWQALRNWSNANFILTSTKGPHDLILPTSVVIEDTFHREGK